MQEKDGARTKADVAAYPCMITEDWVSLCWHTGPENKKSSYRAQIKHSYRERILLCDTFKITLK